MSEKESPVSERLRELAGLMHQAKLTPWAELLERHADDVADLEKVIHQMHEALTPMFCINFLHDSTSKQRYFDAIDALARFRAAPAKCETEQPQQFTCPGSLQCGA